MVVGVLSGLLLFSSLISLIFYIRKIERKINLHYFLFGITATLYFLFSYAGLSVENFQDAVFYEKVINSLIILTGIPFIFLVSNITNDPRKRLQWIFNLMLLVLFIINLILPYGLNFSSLGSLKAMRIPGNSEVHYIEGPVSYMVYLSVSVMIMGLYYLLTAIIRYVKAHPIKINVLMFIFLLSGICLIIGNYIYLLGGQSKFLFVDSLCFFLFSFIFTVRNLINFHVLILQYKNSKLKYESLFENSNDSILILKFGRIVDFNRKTCEMFACTREHLLGKTPYSFSPEKQPDGSDSVERALENIQKALLTDSHTFEWLHQRFDGTLFYSEITLKKLLIGNEEFIQSIVHDISMRKQAEQALEKREELYSSLLTASPDAITVADKNGIITYLSPKAIKVYGETSSEDVVGRNIIEWVVPEEHNRVYETVQKIIEQGQITEREFKLLRKDGSTFYGELSVAAIQSNDGNFDGMMIITRDITARKENEKNLRLSEERFSKMFHTSPDSNMLTDIETGLIIEVNKGFEEVFGFTREEAIGKTTIELGLWYFAAEGRQKLLDKLKKYGDVRNLEVIGRKKNEEKLICDISANIVQVGDNKYLLTILRDVTEQRKAEDALRLSEEKFSIAFRTSPDTLVITNISTGLVIEVNEGFEKMFGYTRSEVIGKMTTELNLWYDPLQRDQFIKEALENGSIKEWIAKGRHKNGSIIIGQFSAEIIEIDKEIHIFTIVRDITEKKKAEEALKESEWRNRIISELTTDYIFVVDVENDGKLSLKWASDNMKTATGREIDDASTSDNWKNIIHHEDQNSFFEFVKNSISTLESGAFECRSFTVNGKQRWINIFAKPHFDSVTKKITFVGAVKDISEKKIADEAIRLSEEKFNLAFRLSPDSLALINLRTMIVEEINDSLERIFGYSREETIGKTYNTYEQWASEEEKADFIGKLREHGRVSNMEATGIRKSGELFNAVLSAEKLVLGEDSFLLIVCRDITEKKKSEEMMALIQYSIDNANDFVYWIDEQARIKYVNNAVARRLGYTKEEMMSMSLFTIDPVFPKGLWNQHWDDLLTNHSLTFETTHRTKNGELFPVEVTANSIEFGNNVYNCAIVRDITERKRNEEMIKSRMRIMDYSNTHSLNELLQYSLDEIGELVKSPVGFFHFVEADQETLRLKAWSTRTLNEFCTTNAWDSRYSLDEAGVWADSVRLKKPIIHNDYESLPDRKGMPEGHANVIRELVVPVIRNDKITAVLGIGNKVTDYTEADVSIVSFIADFAWEIAEKKRTEEALKESESFKALLLDTIPIPVFYKDTNGQYLGFNKAFEKQVGKKYDEMINKDVNEVNKPESAGIHEYYDREVIEKQQTVSYEMHVHVWDGSYNDARFFKAPIKDSNGKVIGVIGTLMDLSIIKEAEKALLESKQEMEWLVRSMASAFIIWGINYDENGTMNDFSFNYFNDAYSRISHLNLADVRNKTVREVWPNTEQGWYDAFGEVAKTGITKTFEMFHSHTDCLYLCTAYRPWETTDRICAILDDITERKRAETALKESEAFLAMLLVTIPIPFYYKNIEGRYIGFNDAFEKFIGKSREEIINKTVFDITSYEISEEHLQKDREILENPSIQIYDMLFTTADGFTHSIINHKAPLLDDTGKAIGLIGAILDISDIKKAEKDLLESKQQMEWLVRSMASAFIVWGVTFDDNGVIKDLIFDYFNDAYSRVSGLNLSDVQYKTVHEVWPETEKSWYQVYGEVASTGVAKTFEMFHAHTHGLYLCTAYRPWDSPNRICVIFDDITERKRAEIALKDSEENLRITLNSIGDAVIATDINGRITQMNPVAQELTGWSFDAAAGRDLADVFRIVNSTTKETINNPVSEVLRSGEIVGLANHTMLISRDGKECQIADSAAPIFNIDGAIVGVVLVFRDITEEYHLQLQIRQREEQFRTIFVNSPFSIAINRLSDGIFLKVNPMFTKMLGITENDVIGNHLYDVFQYQTPDDFNILRNIINEQGTIEYLPMVFKTKQGMKLDVIYSASIIDFEGEKCIVSMTADVTETKKLEEQLQQSQKMEVIGQLAGGIAHDFNNMLAGILGSAEIINFKSPEASRINHHANIIIDTAKRAAELTQKLLTFSRKGKTYSAQLDIHDVIKSAVQILQSSIDKRITINIDYSAGQSRFLGDQTLMQNAILNICINARDAMPNGGSITVSTRNIFLGEHFFKENRYMLEPGNYIEVDITDTGKGIEKDMLEKIFEPFFTTKPVGKGTGLGLSVVYGTVKDHRGAINVYSEVGRGTSFKVFLPVDNRDIIEETKTINEIITGKGCILIVDDEEVIRNNASELLSELGYTSILANDGEDAVEIVKNKDTAFTLVLMDMIMPKVSGSQAFEEIHMIDPDLRVVICSGFSKDDSVNLLLQKGAAGFLQKPYTLTSLSAMIKSVVDNA